ncbi:MAG: NTP transferase domain-containing protein, partial [Desulfobacterales bacterium]|nr:NTP transferase domain-containing protein [Desulfobacterales bacterium]
QRPILLHIIDQLPPGPKAIVVNHCQDDVRRATRHLGVTYLEQPVLNGTGGAILSAGPFLDAIACDHCIITNGDVPFVSPATYERLVDALKDREMCVLGFKPDDKKKYGVLETQSDRVECITEWKYWKDYPVARQAELTICNAGIYAARREILQRYLPILASRPQIVHKEIEGQMTPIEEYFITDLIEYVVRDKLAVGYIVSENETEAMGIDDQTALEKAQRIYRVAADKHADHQTDPKPRAQQ